MFKKLIKIRMWSWLLLCNISFINFCRRTIWRKWWHSLSLHFQLTSTTHSIIDFVPFSAQNFPESQSMSSSLIDLLKWLNLLHFHRSMIQKKIQGFHIFLPRRRNGDAILCDICTRAALHYFECMQANCKIPL